ncbi:hypothetical protein SALBM135S_01813 [Streptomyces alboniger]
MRGRRPASSRVARCARRRRPPRRRRLAAPPCARPSVRPRPVRPRRLRCGCCSHLGPPRPHRTARPIVRFVGINGAARRLKVSTLWITSRTLCAAGRPEYRSGGRVWSGVGERGGMSGYDKDSGGGSGGPDGPGSAHEPRPVSEPSASAERGTAGGAKPGPPAMDPGPKPVLNPDPAPDPGLNPASDPGLNPNPNPGLNPAPDPGLNPNPNPGANPNPAPHPANAPDPSPHPAPPHRVRRHLALLPAARTPAPA